MVLSEGRAALLPTPGDPFLLTYWLDNARKYWLNEVDRLYICLNTPAEPAAVEYMHTIADDHKITLLFIPNQIEHGDALNRLLDICVQDKVMLIEDDGFVFRPGMIDEKFKILEQHHYDVIGSRRGSCGFDILNGARDKWNIASDGYGDQGPNFWPCYFFCKTELLTSTDRNFGARAWTQGELIEPLGVHVVEPVCYGDTFVNTSLQIRAKVPADRILQVNQNHGHPDDVEHYLNGTDLFNGTAYWTHVGSLSSGFGGVLRDNCNRPLSRRHIDPDDGPTHLPPDWCKSEFEVHEWERRVQWWLTFWEHAQTKGLPESMRELNELYKLAIEQICTQYHLSAKRIMHRQAIYRSLGL